MQQELFIKIPVSPTETKTINVRHIISIESGFEDKARILLSPLSSLSHINTNIGYENLLESLGRIKAGTINIIKIRTIS